MIEQMPLNQIVSSKVYAPSGDVAGIIEDLVIDPGSGMVRFAALRMEQDDAMMLPWAAMTFSKSKMGFTLTHLGVSLIGDRARKQ